MNRYVFKTKSRNESDEWSNGGPAITDNEPIDAVERALHNGPIIVEHWHYRGGAAPARHVFEDWESFERFLRSVPFAGDAIDVWSFTDLCTPERRLASGKCPAADGKTPKSGSY